MSELTQALVKLQAETEDEATKQILRVVQDAVTAGGLPLIAFSMKATAEWGKIINDPRLRDWSYLASGKSFYAELALTPGITKLEGIIKAIKTIRAYSHLGLKEAKDVVDLINSGQLAKVDGIDKTSAMNLVNELKQYWITGVVKEG